MQLFYQNPDLQSLWLRDCYASRTRGVVLCQDPWTPVIAGVVRGDTRAAFAVIPSVVRGEISPAWVYVLRASLKTQFPSDLWDFVGFIPLAQGRLGR